MAVGARFRASTAPVVLVTMAAVTVFAVLRTVIVGHGHVSSFVDAGTYFVGPHAHLVRGYGGSIGFDGQFTYRMALDPFDLAKVGHGVTLDKAIREQRILYPAIVWLVALGGRLALVPYALVAVNIVAYGALAGAGARFALDADRTPWAGLLIAAPWSILLSLARDLNEVVAGALLAWALWAVRRGHWGRATALLSLGVLARESLLVTVIAVAAVAGLEIVRRERGPALRDAAWVVPVLVYAGWQVCCRLGYGDWALVDGSNKNFDFPVKGVVGAIGYWFSDAGRAFDVGVQFVLLVVLTASAAPTLRRASTACTVERVAWVFWIGYALCESQYVWTDAVEFRASSDLQVITAILTVSALARPVKAFSWGAGAGWAITFGRRVFSI